MLAALVLMAVGIVSSWRSTVEGEDVSPEVSAWKAYSEIGANAAQALAIVGGAFFLFKWMRERSDHTTENLLKLEDRFNDEKVLNGRKTLEHDSKYEGIKDYLRQWVEAEDRRNLDFDKLSELDAMLRFYLILRGVLQAKQVNLASARTCFRYYLCHFFHPDRKEFHDYVVKCYPTLTAWLDEDSRRHPLAWWRRPLRLDPRFTTPEHFGWDSCHERKHRPDPAALRLWCREPGCPTESGIKR